MSKRENVIIMFNKLKTAKTTKNLQEEFEEVYKDLTATREEIGQAVDKRTEEMQEEMLNILAKAICFMIVGKDEKAFEFLIEQYELIKKDLSDNNHDDRQAIIKILM